MNYQTPFSIAVAALLLSISTARSQDPPMNLVIIQTDEHHFGTLGCYGGKIVGTPHIDSIARQGVTCTAYYAATPVCSPSRGCLIAPTTASPLRRLYFLTWPSETYTSLWPGR